MSESSEPTSSQLDDIELAEPVAKTYEHHTDVEFMFGEPSGAQQWSVPVMPTLASAREHARHDSDHGWENAAFRLAGTAGRRVEGGSEAHARDSAARLAHDSGAAVDELQRVDDDQSSQCLSDGQSDVSEDGIMHFDEHGSVVLDLLSPAFTLNEQAWQQGARLGKSPADIIRQRACTGLGVERAKLRYFELREVSAQQLRASGRYAIAVDRAGFTLQDMEEALAEKTRLHETTQKSTAALEAMQELVRDLDADRSKLHLQTAEYKEDIRRLEQRCQEAEVQNAMLAQRLARSDQQRAEGQQKIQQLRHEFMDVQARMPQRRAAGVSNVPLSARRSSANLHRAGSSGARIHSARGPAPDPPGATPRRYTPESHGLTPRRPTPDSGLTPRRTYVNRAPKSVNEQAFTPTGIPRLKLDNFN